MYGCMDGGNDGKKDGWMGGMERGSKGERVYRLMFICTTQYNSKYTQISMDTLFVY